MSSSHSADPHPTPVNPAGEAASTRPRAPRNWARDRQEILQARAEAVRAALARWRAERDCSLVSAAEAAAPYMPADKTVTAGYSSISRWEGSADGAAAIRWQIRDAYIESLGHSPRELLDLMDAAEARWRVMRYGAAGESERQVAKRALEAEERGLLWAFRQLSHRDRRTVRAQADYLLTAQREDAESPTGALATTLDTLDAWSGERTVTPSDRPAPRAGAAGHPGGEERA